MKSVSEFVEKAAQSYLQSAVFIDDEIYTQAHRASAEQFSLRTRKPAMTRPVEEPVVVTPSASVEVEAEATFHPRDIVTGFARKGIVCALYEPPVEFSTDEDSEIFKLCQSADLVILDWDFRKDDGARMRELVAALTSQSRKAIPHHSRLLVVFTTTPSLEKVASALFGKLKDAGEDPRPADSTNLRLDVGAIRIVVLGKAGLSRVGTEQTFTVSEAQLPDRVVSEFVSKHMGIVSGYALLAMAAVKRNSRRILGKFSPDIDGAFLLHRALVLHSEDAFEEMPSLLADEFLAIVEDATSELAQLQDIVADAVNSLRITPPEKQWTLSDGKAQELEPIAKELLINGAANLKQKFGTCKQVDKLIGKARGFNRNVSENIIADLKRAVEPNDSTANMRLAALFSTRTFYGKTPRHLTFGSIIREQQGTPDVYVYRMCLVPLCDSVRLADGKPVRYPFCQLKQISGQRGRGLVIELPDGSLMGLVATGRPRDLWVEEFKPKDGAVYSSIHEGKTVFTLADGRRFEWIAQVKAVHTQRIAHDLGQAMSRVGLTEAEWIRLLTDRE